MSYGQKSAWGRQTGSIPSQQLNPNLFTNQMGMATQGYGGLGAMVNQAAFSTNNMLSSQRSMVRPVSPPVAVNTQKTFLGTVTKLMETYGFVDEDVFFQTSVVRGAMPRVGERVMVEASFNPSMPFKWNAYRIQVAQSQDILLHSQQQYSSRGASTTSNRWGAAPADSRGGLQVSSAADRARLRRYSPPNARRSPIMRMRSRSPLRKEANKRDREKSLLRDSRTRSPTASKRDDKSPARRRQRIIPRYMCYIPKQIHQSNELKYKDLHKRYISMYVPSDFIRCDMSWLKSIQVDEPIKFSPHPISYTVLHKQVDLEGVDAAEENPPDADARYVVKVLLLAHPGQSALRQKVYGLLPDGSIDEFAETQPLLRNLNLLVGTRGKTELMGIGGAWSPSLDGENPMDPQTIVNTAVRTTRSLVGVDLSSCSKWYKMVHLHYYRAEKNRVDSVVLMLPDTSSSSLMPSPEAFAVIEQGLKDQLAAKLAAIDAEQFPMEPAENATGAANAAAGEGAATANTIANESGVSEEANTEEPTGDKPTEANTEANTAAKKTCWSQLNVKTMKVAELREELDARGIDSKGVKNTLCQRLQEALDKEKAEDGGVPKETSPKEATPKEATPDKAKPVEAAKPAEQADVIVIKQEQMDVTEKPAEELELVEKVDDAAAAEKAEKELKELEKAKEKFEKEKKERKAALERHYASVPKEPTVLVYPSKTAKGGKFDCKCSTLSSLLQYSLEDNKEASFEVFLFAEALREAIDRSKAFLVYHALDSALSKEDERKRRDDALNSETLIVVNEPVKEHTAENGDAEKVSNGDVPMETDATDKPVADKPVVAKEEVADDEDIVIIAEKKVAPADPRTAYKAFVNDMDMFSAFAHFDENVCGFIENPDVEEILFTLGVDFSRGDMQRLIKKLSSKERINYRNLTDKWVDKEGNVKYMPTPGPEAKSLSALAAGHTLRPDEAGKERSQEPALGSTPDVTDTGVVFYKGSVLNIAQTMELQKVMETERDASLLKSEQVEFQLKSTKEQRDYLDKKKKRLEEDLDRYKKKLHDAEKTVKNSQEDTILMKTSLEDCKRFGERIVNIVDRLFPPPKKEEKKKDEKSKDDSKSEKSGEQSKDPQQHNAETTAAGEICEIIDDVEMQPEEASEQAVPEQQSTPAAEAETVVPNGDAVATTTESAAEQPAKQAEQTSQAPATTTPATAAASE